MKTGSKRTSLARGFSLFEMVIVLALISLISGAVAPALSTMVESKSRRLSKLEMQELVLGFAAYFEDTDALATNPAELITSTVPGWAGPYLLGTFDDTISGGNGYLVDAWSQPYSVALAGDVVTLTSRGKDGALASADDLVLSIDVTSIRRSKTLAELRTIQIAIDAYNALFLTTNPLPANWTTIYSRLVTNGLLPNGAGYDTDGWGLPYVPDPAGAMPVTKVTSSAL